MSEGEGRVSGTEERLQNLYARLLTATGKERTRIQQEINGLKVSEQGKKDTERQTVFGKKIGLSDGERDKD